MAAVPTSNKDAYIAHATKAAGFFKEYGVTRMVECWGDDVPHGKVTDFYDAVKAEENETIIFSWFEYPSKQARDAAMKQMMEDPRMQELSDMPFDGKRMIYGGFAPIFDKPAANGGMGYVDGFLLAVPEKNKQAYIDMAATAAQVFYDHGATRMVENWGDDVPDGEVTWYRRAVKAEEGESVLFSWIEWPSKEVRDKGQQAVMQDERMKDMPQEMPFDGMRMMWGGFKPVLDL
ncbi:hypothetical protein GCM10010136_05420 [Limoniibacter endophyticus]|uniref:DUF1428 domain-containing protein n=1 Tax=Limoniibacter endophyticus TaxID=1565040 RepID=A0A8J3GG78_9HYPH|nr:hypothetical protein GCM10010136_05420 [Limoniibacter endophyticus]